MLSLLFVIDRVHNHVIDISFFTVVSFPNNYLYCKFKLEFKVKLNRMGRSQHLWNFSGLQLWLANNMFSDQY